MGFSWGQHINDVLAKAVASDDRLRAVGISKILSVLSGCSVLPGFADAHVHLREPGFSYKETIRTGTLAAAHGGYTDVCCMPNLSPVPDTLEHLKPQLQAIEAQAQIGVRPFGAITKGEEGIALSNMEEIAPYVAGFSDDGRGVQNRDVMRLAMRTARRLGKPIAAHCEDNSLLRGGYVNDGAYARARGHAGICSESEWGPIERDIALVRETDCAYHVCHVSTKQSVEILRKAKREGLNVTCETAPHYLLLNDDMLKEDGRYKMNPPIRSEDDRQALLEGIVDGTIDMIATDHAPHSAEEKNRGLKGSLMGVVGLECAFPVLYTGLVKTGCLSLDALIQKMAVKPRERFGLPAGDDYSFWDLRADTRVDPEQFLSMGRSTPFEGAKVCARCLLTLKNGKIVWSIF